MAVLKNTKDNELIITCHCGCDDSVHISVEDFPDGGYAFMTYMNGNFYSEQKHPFIEKIKKIWAIIRNKDYFYSDIVMTKEEFDEFAKWVNQNRENNSMTINQRQELREELSALSKERLVEKYITLYTKCGGM